MPVTEKHLTRGARRSPKPSPEKHTEIASQLRAAEELSKRHVEKISRLEAELTRRVNAEQRVQQLENEKHALLDYIQEVNEESAIERDTIEQLLNEKDNATQHKALVDGLQAELSSRQKELETAEQKLVSTEHKLEQIMIKEQERNTNDQRAELNEAAQMNSELLHAVQ